MQTLITAHSGCEDTVPNSAESIRAGSEAGADCVEIDVRSDAAGGLWLTHDARTDYSGALALDTAFDIIAEAGIAVNCDLKTPDTLHLLLKKADEYGIERAKLILSGSVTGEAISDGAVGKRAQVYWNLEELFGYWLRVRPKQTERVVADCAESLDIPADNDFMAALHSGDISYKPLREVLMKRECTQLFLHTELQSIGDFCKAAGVATLNLHWRQIETSDINAVREGAGLELSLWTVNEEPALRRLLAAQPANITTLRPRLALALRSEAAEGRKLS